MERNQEVLMEKILDAVSSRYRFIDFSDAEGGVGFRLRDAQKEYNIRGTVNLETSSVDMKGCGLELQFDYDSESFGEKLKKACLASEVNLGMPDFKPIILRDLESLGIMEKDAKRHEVVFEPVTTPIQEPEPENKGLGM